jgi:hypothetical protein
MRRLIFVLFLAAGLPCGAAGKSDTAQAINRIVDEELNHSQLAETAEYLDDRIGGRMTNSPQMRTAESWAIERFRTAGLKSVRRQGYEFGRGWAIDHSSVRMLTPRVLELRAIPVAWTPPTAGTLTAEVIVAPMSRERDLEKWKGKLAGKIVLVTKPDEGSEPDVVPFRRLSAEDLAKLEYKQPQSSEVVREHAAERDRFAAKRDAFLKAEGALAWVRMSYRDGSLLHGEGYAYERGATPSLPGIEIAAEDYRRLARLEKAGVTPLLEVTSAVRYYDDDPQAYNILADIPGRDAKAGYVMAGAHLDSWVAGDGAADNGAGSIVVLEAARVLARIGVTPKRTMRFALWSGEEQGLLGSLAYVHQFLADRPAVTDPEKAKVNPYYTWTTRWPISARAGHGDLVAYFNLDNGSGKVRGIYTEGNLAVVPIFREWLAPFASMGATTVATSPTGGTDHVFMQSVGIPGFQFIQDPLDYGSRVHHSNLDTYDHLKIADLKQATIILASFMLQAAERDEPLPRMPLPTQPNETNPYSYDTVDDEQAQRPRE